MPSIIEPKNDLAALAERLGKVTEALKRLPIDHPRFTEKVRALRKEIKAIAGRLRED